MKKQKNSNQLQKVFQFGSGITVQQSIAMQTDDPLNDIEFLVSRTIGILTVLAGLFFIVYFILGALKWISAGGDSGQISKARDQMIQGTLGLIVIVAAYGVIGLIGTVIGIQLLRPAAVLGELVP